MVIKEWVPRWMMMMMMIDQKHTFMTDNPADDIPFIYRLLYRYIPFTELLEPHRYATLCHHPLLLWIVTTQSNCYNAKIDFLDVIICKNVVSDIPLPLGLPRSACHNPRDDRILLNRMSIYPVRRGSLRRSVVSRGDQSFTKQSHKAHEIVRI